MLGDVGRPSQRVGRGSNALLEGQEESGGASGELGGVGRAGRGGEGWEGLGDPLGEMGRVRRSFGRVRDGRGQ